MMDLLRLPTETIWLVLDLATPATKVQTLYALGWFDHFWPAVFAMSMDDMFELLQAVGRDDVLSKKQAQFYMCVIRNWCYRYSSPQEDCYQGNLIAAHDVHPRLLEMWILYNHDTDPRELKREAVRAGHIENYKRFLKQFPESVMDEIDIPFEAGQEELARQLRALKPELTVYEVTIAIRKLPLSLLQEMYETYAPLFDDDDVLETAAISCRVEVLAWLRTKIDRCVTHQMITSSASSCNVSREVLQWYVNNGYHLVDGDSLFDYNVPDATVIRRICASNNLHVHWRQQLVLLGGEPNHFWRRPELKEICSTKPFDPAVATAYCLQHDIEFTDRDLVEYGLDLPVLKWMNAYTVIPPSTTVLRSPERFDEHDPAIMVWLLKERNDPITANAMMDVAASGRTELYAMLHDKFPHFIAPRRVLFMAALHAPFDMIKLLFRRHPYFRKRKVLQWLYKKEDETGSPGYSILIFLEVALKMQEAAASQEIKGRENEILARCT